MMIIEQTVTIPADYIISLKLPKSLPTGIKARIEISIPEENPSVNDGIENVRMLLKKEMGKKGTLNANAAAGDGWSKHINEHYAKS